MDPVFAAITLARPREEVFAYLVDIANHPEFCDHFLTDWHLTREESEGVGAGARFRIAAPLNRFAWADLTIVEAQPPFRLVLEGRGGKYNRNRIRAVYTLQPAPDEQTRVELEAETEPALPTDRLLEALGARGWTKRKTGRALRRLRAILEEGRQRGARATVAAR